MKREDEYFQIIPSTCINKSKSECNNPCIWKQGPKRQFCSAKYKSLQKVINIDLLNSQKIDDDDKCSNSYSQRINIYKNDRKHLFDSICFNRSLLLHNQNKNELEKSNKTRKTEKSENADEKLEIQSLQIQPAKPLSMSDSDHTLIHDIIPIPIPVVNPPPIQIISDSNSISSVSVPTKLTLTSKSTKQWIDKCFESKDTNDFIANQTQFDIVDESIQQGFQNPFLIIPDLEKNSNLLCILTYFLLLYSRVEQEKYLKDHPEYPELSRWYNYQDYKIDEKNIDDGDDPYDYDLNSFNNDNHSNIFDILQLLIATVILQNDYNNWESLLHIIPYRNDISGSGDVIDLSKYTLNDIYNLMIHLTKSPSSQGLNNRNIIINPFSYRLMQLFDPKDLKKWGLDIRFLPRTHYYQSSTNVDTRVHPADTKLKFISDLKNNVSNFKGIYQGFNILSGQLENFIQRQHKNRQDKSKDNNQNDYTPLLY